MAGSERVLAGFVPDERDLNRFVQNRQYRVREEAWVTFSNNWPPKWVAAFESAQIAQRQQIRFCAPVMNDVVKRREELFPDERQNEKSGRIYRVLELGAVSELPKPVPVQKPRRTTFIETTLSKLLRATTVNDLFNDSEIEDVLWERLGSISPWTERQWPVEANGQNYLLDFAIFCRGRNLNVEVDGRQHHIYEDRSVYDAARDTDMNAAGWSVNRFTTAAVREDSNACVRAIMETIEQCGGLDGRPPTLAPTARQRRKAGNQMAFPDGLS